VQGEVPLQVPADADPMAVALRVVHAFDDARLAE
jgi:hypothetical protein